jgi:hypothetical protein
MPEDNRDPKREERASKARKPYRKPELKRHGHMAEVTQKSGTSFDNSQQWPTKK